MAMKTILKIDKDLPVQSTTASVTNFKPSYRFIPQWEAEIMPPSIFFFFWGAGGAWRREGSGGRGEE